jgi:hypothetical protein
MDNLDLPDFDLVDNLLDKHFVDYDLVQQKLLELNNRISGYSVFRDYLLSPEYIDLLKDFENNNIQKVYENAFITNAQIKALNQSAKFTSDVISVFLKVPEELRNEEFIKALQSMVAEAEKLGGKIHEAENQQNQNNQVLDNLSTLLNPAIEAIKVRQIEYEKRINEIDKSFASKVKKNIRLSKILIFVIAAILYFITEYLPGELEERFKLYKEIFHIALFGLGYFLVEPISEIIKRLVKKRRYLSLNSTLRNNFLEIETSIIQKCSDNGIQYSTVAGLITKFNYFRIFVQLANEKMKEDATTISKS